MMKEKNKSDSFVAKWGEKARFSRLKKRADVDLIINSSFVCEKT
jgi:hypothetical protein